MAKNIFGKSRPINKPYAIYRNGIGDYHMKLTNMIDGLFIVMVIMVICIKSILLWIQD